MASEKKLYIGTNLKMYKKDSETLEYLDELVRRTADLTLKDTELFVIPSFTVLERAVKRCAGRGIRIGAQNMHWAQCGQYTGEVSPLSLAEIGVELVELGHAERRNIFGESDEIINRKTASAVSHGFITLLCIGESVEDRASGRTDAALSAQLRADLKDVYMERPGKLWIAYEPVWAIGGRGAPAEPEYVGERCVAIRRTLEEIYPTIDIPLLYGGGVSAENAKAYLSIGTADGLFIGRSAWDINSFDRLLHLLCS